MKLLKMQHGLTLLELIIVLVISSIVIIGSSSLLLHGFTLYKLSKESITNTWNAQNAIEEITRDLREAVSIEKNSTNELVIHINSEDGGIQYIVKGNCLMRNNVINNGTKIEIVENILANNINSITFEYYDKDGVSASINNIAYIKVGIKSESINFSTIISLLTLC